MRVWCVAVMVLTVPLTFLAADEADNKQKQDPAEVKPQDSGSVGSQNERAVRDGLKAAKSGKSTLGWISCTTGQGGTEDQAYWLYPNTLVWETITVRPIAWFGACKEGKSDARYLYFCLFKTPEPKPGEKLPRFLDLPAPEVLSIFGSSSGEEQKGSVVMKLLGKKVTLSHDCLHDRKTNQVAVKSVKFNDKELKDEKAKVFIVDLTGDEPTLHPVEVKLPSSVIDMAKRDANDANSEQAAKLLMKTVEKLKADPEVARILEPDKPSPK